MCLVIVALDAAPRYPFIIAANRDERHARPTEPASWWRDEPPLLGGRDLAAGGTWLAVDRAGRIAAVTNVRDDKPRPAPRSRGTLVTDYLRGTESPAGFAARLGTAAHDYGAFNLLLFDGSDLRYASNRAPPATVPRGVHALSNAPWGTEWPKTASGRAGVERLLDSDEPLEPLLALLGERDAGEDEDRYRRAHFIAGPVYGTRCSTVVLVAADGTLTFAERSFDALGRPTGEVRETFVVAAAA